MAFYSHDLLTSPLFHTFWQASVGSDDRVKNVRRQALLEAARLIAQGVEALQLLLDGHTDPQQLQHLLHEPSIKVRFPKRRKVSTGHDEAGAGVSRPVVTLVVPSQLLLGIVRVHHSQSTYLAQDAEHALLSFMRTHVPAPAEEEERAKKHGEGQAHHVLLPAPTRGKKAVIRALRTPPDIVLPDEEDLFGPAQGTGYLFATPAVTDTIRSCPAASLLTATRTRPGAASLQPPALATPIGTAPRNLLADSQGASSSSVLLGVTGQRLPSLMLEPEDELFNPVADLSSQFDILLSGDFGSQDFSAQHPSMTAPLAPSDDMTPVYEPAGPVDQQYEAEQDVTHVQLAQRPPEPAGTLSPLMQSPDKQLPAFTYDDDERIEALHDDTGEMFAQEVVPPPSPATTIPYAGQGAAMEGLVQDQERADQAGAQQHERQGQPDETQVRELGAETAKQRDQEAPVLPKKRKLKSNQVDLGVGLLDSKLFRASLDSSIGIVNQQILALATAGRDKFIKQSASHNTLLPCLQPTLLLSPNRLRDGASRLRALHRLRHHRQVKELQVNPMDMDDTVAFTGLISAGSVPSRNALHPGLAFPSLAVGARLQALMAHAVFTASSCIPSTGEVKAQRVPRNVHKAKAATGPAPPPPGTGPTDHERGGLVHDMAGQQAAMQNLAAMPDGAHMHAANDEQQQASDIQLRGQSQEWLHLAETAADTQEHDLNQDLTDELDTQHLSTPAHDQERRTNTAFASGIEQGPQPAAAGGDVVSGTQPMTATQLHQLLEKALPKHIVESGSQACDIVGQLPTRVMQVASVYHSALYEPVTTTRVDMSPAGPEEDTDTAGGGGHVRPHGLAAQHKIAAGSVALHTFTPPSKSTRLSAARFFCDSLVLMNIGMLRLSQAEPYGSIKVTGQH